MNGDGLIRRRILKVSHSAYGIADLIVPVGSLYALDSISEFRGYETPHISYVMDAISRKEAYIDPLQDAALAKEQGLPSTYDGSGVIVGVFDTGIDYQHVNYKDPETGKTRIKEALLFRKCNADTGPFTPDSTQFDVDKIVEKYDSAHLDTLTTDYYLQFHGTHTSGIAAGSYNGNIVSEKTGKVLYSGERGIAYKSDIILSSSPYLRDEFQRRALEEMAHYADSVNEPIVINLSLGSHAHWLDGKSAICSFYDNFTDHGKAPGRIVCVSAGNSGKENFTIHENLDETNDYTIRSFLQNLTVEDYHMNSRIIFFCSDTTQIEVAIEEYKKINGKYVYQKCSNEQDLINNNMMGVDSDSSHDNRFYGLVLVKIKKNEWDGETYYAVKLKSKYNKPCNVRAYQVFDDKPINTLPFKSNGVDGFIDGDATSSINAQVCTYSVLSVGSWTASGSWIDQNDTLRTDKALNDNYPVGDITSFSSFTDGDDNNEPRPDFCAPGVAVISGISSYDTKDLDANYGKFTVGIAEDNYGRKDSKPSYFGCESGTSMSCPNAAGIIALWLQANPYLSVNDIREIIKKTADYGDIPVEHRNRAGAGRINALKGLQYILENYTTDIQDIEDGHLKALNEPAVRKVIKNARIVIIKSGKEYSVAGQQMS